MEWLLDPNIDYFNHGSFGATPRAVIESQQEWRSRSLRNPQAFLSRELEGLLEQTCLRLGEFVGCAGEHLVPVENATHGMNIVARSFELQAGDEVLLTTHEYGAVKRIWQQTALAAGAKMVQATLPEPIDSAEEVVEHLLRQATSRTRLIVISHVTSPTALVLPVELLCRRAEQQGIPVCVDGPHALAMRPLALAQMGCAFYTASCHKWLSGPVGTGFLYVHPRYQQRMRPCVMSWGGSTCGRPKSWKDEFLWVGTRDMSGFLAIPTAIDVLERYGLENFRDRSHALAATARRRLLQQWPVSPLSADSSEFYGSMVAIPLPAHVPVPATWTGLPHPLQQELAERHRIELPVIKWGHRMLVRISCHLYHTVPQLERVCDVLVDCVNRH